MGYTHYWYVKEKELPQVQFNDFIADVQAIVDYSENKLGIMIANGVGDDRPTINQDVVRLNGSNSQPIGIWTTSESIAIPWPSNSAGLVNMNTDPISDKRDGSWFGGDELIQRVAPIENGLGSGSYETFVISRVHPYFENGEGFECCKTAYRPYDITVTAILIAFKHHFPKITNIVSDGDYKDWADGMRLCEELFGYGAEFKFRRDE